MAMSTDAARARPRRTPSLAAPCADQTDWDLGFLALGAVLLIAGWLLTRDRDGHVARGRVLERGHVQEDADAALSHDDAAQPRLRRVPDDGR
jgi:hypothetical protein